MTSPTWHEMTYDELVRSQARWRCLLRAAHPANVAARCADGWAVNRRYSLWSKIRLTALFLRVDATPWAGRGPIEPWEPAGSTFAEGATDA